MVSLAAGAALTALIMRVPTWTITTNPRAAGRLWPLHQMRARCTASMAGRTSVAGLQTRPEPSQLLLPAVCTEDPRT